jgi:hypothetical protein
MSEKIYGAYATVIGYNLSFSVSTDGTVQVATAPQVSAGITASVSVPLFTCRIPDDRKGVLQINADVKRTSLSWPSLVFCS